MCVCACVCVCVCACVCFGGKETHLFGISSCAVIIDELRVDHVIARKVESICDRDVTCAGIHQTLHHSLASGVQYGGRTSSFATNDDSRLREVNISKVVRGPEPSLHCENPSHPFRESKGFPFLLSIPGKQNK